MTDAERLADSLRFIGELVQQWIDWDTSERSRESLETDGDTAIMSLPVPYWPKHGQMTNWIDVLNNAANELEKQAFDYVQCCKALEMTLQKLPRASKVVPARTPPE